MTDLKIVHSFVSLVVWLISPLLLFTLTDEVNSQQLEDQIITWADFSNVIRVTSSMTYVYAATTEGIIRYNKIEQRFEEPLTGRVGLRGDEIRGIWTDTFDKKLLLQTDAGKFEYDHFFKAWTEVFELSEFETDVRHVVTPVGMLAPFGFNTLADGTIVDRFGRNFPINDIIDDGTGTLWIGTWGFGLATAESSSKLIELLPYGLLQNQVSAILDEDSLVWVGGPLGTSYRSGLTAFNLAENRFSYLETGLSSGSPEADVYCLAGNSEAIFVGSSEGLFVYDRALDKITDQMTERNGLTGRVVSALEIVGDSLFVGTTGGIAIVDFIKDSITYLNQREFLNQMIYDFERVDNTLWIAAELGAYRLLLDSGELFKFKDPGGSLFSRVYALDRYGDKLWFLGEDGLLRLNLKTGQTVDYPAGSLHLGNSFYPFRTLAVNDRVAAVSSSRGFTLFFDEKGKPDYREFSTDDGLPSSNVMALLFDGDYLWVGTERGLSSFWWNNPNRVD